MTLIPGKDAPLEDSISDMSAKLSQLGFDIEEARWLNPVPNVWSVHIRDRSCPVLFANGKGASREAALASALGEFFERLSCNDFFTDYFLGEAFAGAPFVHYPNERWFAVKGNALPEGILDEPSLQHYNMNGQLKASMLTDTNSGNRARGICAIPFIRQSTGGEVWFPVNIVGNLHISNGMAAGNTKYEARVQALSEIFTRHIKNTIISSGISLPRIPDEVVARYPRILAGIEVLRERGFGVIVQDASLGGKFPLVNITLLNPENGGCLASFGAHPKFEVAFERALTELLQGRALSQLASFPAPSFDVQEVADQQNLEAHFIDSSGVVAWDLLATKTDYEYTEWNIEGDSKAEFEHLCYLIHRVDMDIYIADYEHLGVYCCRIVVPGMSEVYPVEDLVWENNSAGIRFRHRCLKLPELNHADCVQLLDELEEQGVDDQQRVSDLVGVLADPGTPWESMRIGELKGLLCLAAGELESALGWIEWVLHFGQIAAERMALYRCLYQCLSFALDEERSLEAYEGVLRLAHRPVYVDRALQMLNGEALFSDLPSDDGTLSHFGRHCLMLDAYQRLHKAKQAYYGAVDKS